MKPVKPTSSPTQYATGSPSSRLGDGSPEQCFELVAPNEAPNGNALISMLKMNGVTRNFAYGFGFLAGDSVSIEFDYGWSPGGLCSTPSCLVEIYAGFRGSVGNMGSCFTGSVGPTPNPYPIVFNAQLTVGCNLIFATSVSIDSAACPLMDVTDGYYVGAIWSNASVGINSAPSAAPVARSSLLPSLAPTLPESEAISSLYNLSHFNVQYPLVLTGTIYSHHKCVTNWTVSNYSTFSTSTSSLNSGVQTVSPNQWSTANLVLKANVLNNRPSYIFILRCGRLSSQISVYPNLPPQNGNFHVQPSSGYEVSQLFQFSAGGWTDRNLPLTYQFGYYSSQSSPLQSISGQSLLNSSSSFLPAGLKSALYFINCTVQVFNSYSASSIAIQSVLVQPASDQVIQNYISSTVQASHSISLNEINLIGTLLSVTNCTNAPDCNSLYRGSCSSSATDHTCGACIAGYIGEIGSHNSACFDPAARTADSVSQAKECRNNCSSHGVCSFVNVNTLRTVSFCSIVSVDCQATCSCSSGFVGSACADTADSLQQKQSLRGILLSNLYNISKRASTVAAVVASVSSLSVQAIASDELSPAGASLALSSAHSLLSTASQLQVRYQDVSSQILQTVDTAASVSNVTDSHLFQTINVLRLHGSLISQQLYPGQSGVSNVLANFKTSSNTLSYATIAVPLSSLEQFNGIKSSEIDVSQLFLDDYKNFQSTKIDLIEVNANLFGNQSALKSKPLVVTISRPLGTLPPRNITVTLINIIPHVVISDDSNFTTVCLKQQSPPLVTSHLCPLTGHMIIHNCTHKIGILRTKCPQYRAACSNLTDLTQEVCSVASFTQNETVCTCTINMDQSTRRRLSSEVESNIQSTSLQIVATGGYFIEDQSNTFHAAPKLTSSQGLEKVIIVICMFAVWWAIGLVILLSAAWRDPASRIRRIKPSVSTSSAEKKERAFIDAYIYEVIPAIFRGNMSFYDVLLTVFRRHKYAMVFYTDCDLVPAVAKIVTLQSFLMYLLAVLYDLQSPSDDGSCPRWQTEAQCLSERSPLDSSQSYCQWNSFLSDDEGPSRAVRYDCVYREPAATIQEILSILVIVSVTTAIFQFPMEYLLDIVKASTATHALKKELVHEEKPHAPPDHYLTAVLSAKTFRELLFGDRSLRNITENAAVARSLAMISKQKTSGKVSGVDRRHHDIFYDSFTQPHNKSTQAEFLLTEKTAEELAEIIESTFQRKLLSTRESLVSAHAFDSQWGIILSSETYSLRPNIFQSICEDVEHVRQKSIEKIHALNAAAFEEQVGFEILHLFVMDILGTDSPAALIFENKLDEDFGKFQIVQFPSKLIAGIILVLLNVFFAYYSLLYGYVKGYSWQILYLYACILQMCIEIFVHATLECFWINYVIPLQAVDDLAAAHDTLVELVDRHYEDKRLLEDESPDLLNAPDYLFISTNVAKAFPNINESEIVLSYRSYLPGVRARHWNKSQSFSFGGVQTPGRQQTVSFAGTVLLTTTFGSFMKHCASAPSVLHRIFVRICQPFLISGVTFLFNLTLKSPLYCALLVLGFAAIIGYIFRQTLLFAVLKTTLIVKYFSRRFLALFFDAIQRYHSAVVFITGALWCTINEILPLHSIWTTVRRSFSMRERKRLKFASRTEIINDNNDDVDSSGDSSGDDEFEEDEPSLLIAEERESSYGDSIYDSPSMGSSYLDMEEGTDEEVAPIGLRLSGDRSEDDAGVHYEGIDGINLDFEA